MKESWKKWNILKEAMVTTATEVLPMKERQRKAKWMTDEEILDLMRKRQQVQQRGSTECKILDKNIKNKCKEAKEGWLNDK